MPKRKILFLVFLLTSVGAEMWTLARSGQGIRIAQRDDACSVRAPVTAETADETRRRPC